MASEVKVKVSLLSGAVATGLAKVKAQFSQFRNELNSQFASFVAFGSIVAGLDAMIRKASAIDDISKRFSAPARELQRVANVGRDSGVQLEDVAKSWNKLAVNQQKAIDGSDEMRNQFKALGIPMREVVTMSIDDLFYRVADATASAEDRGKAYAAVVQLMGRNAGTLYTTLEQGAGKIKAQGDEIGVMSDSAIAKLDEVGDQLERMKNTVFVYGGEILIFFKKIAESIGAIVGDAVNKIEGMLNLIDAPLRAAWDKLTGGKGDLDFDQMQRGFDLLGKPAGGTDILDDLKNIWSRKPPEPPSRQKPVDEEVDASKSETVALEKQTTLRERLAELQREAANAELDTQSKITALMEQRAALLKEADAAPDVNAKLERQIKAAEVQKEIIAAQKQLQAEQQRAAEQVATAQERLEKVQSDRAYSALRTSEERAEFLNQQVEDLNKEIAVERDAKSKIELRIQREEVLRKRDEETQRGEEAIHVAADALRRIGGGGNVAAVSGSDRNLKEAQAHTVLLKALIEETKKLGGGSLLMK